MPPRPVRPNRGRARVGFAAANDAINAAAPPAAPGEPSALREGHLLQMSPATPGTSAVLWRVLVDVRSCRVLAGGGGGPGVAVVAPVAAAVAPVGLAAAGGAVAPAGQVAPAPAPNAGGGAVAAPVGPVGAAPVAAAVALVISPAREPRGGAVGKAARDVMEELIVTDLDLPEVFAPLEEAGLADPARLLKTAPAAYPGALRQPPSGLAFKAGLDYVLAKVSRDATSALPAPPVLETHLRTIVLAVSANEARLAEQIRVRSRGVDGAGDVAAAPEAKLSAKEAGIELADELARCVVAQEHGHPVRLEDEPSTADVLAVYDQLRRDPPRAPGFASLGLAGRLGGGADDGARHVKGKVFGHARGESRDAEDDLLDRALDAWAHGGAFPAGDGVVAVRVDEGSGVRGADADADTILMARRRAIADAKVTFREFKRGAHLSAADRASFGDGVVKHVNDALRLGGTLTAAVDDAAKSCARIAEESKGAAVDAGAASDRRRSGTVTVGSKSRKARDDSDSSGDDSPRRDAPRGRGRDRRERDRSRDRGRDRRERSRDRGRGRDRDRRAKPAGRKRSRSPEPPKGLCYRWAKHQVTKHRGDECKYSTSECKFDHKFKKGDRRWAEDKWGDN